MIQKQILGWYDRNRRSFPWRALPGDSIDPYRVWLSEIMLQQTRVDVVVPYFRSFLLRWPTVGALAAAPLDHVLAAWAGLGYYSRARNLHRCARIVVERHGGQFPSSEADLLELPGIGPYTAAAIAAIAFGARATPVDGNIERVMARLFAVEAPLPGSKPELRRLARSLTPPQGAGAYAQALMDLGATVCRPKRPLCLVCPVRGDCRAHARGREASLPARIAKPSRPVRAGSAFLALRRGMVLLRRRRDTGLLGGMLEVPSTDWGHALTPSEALRAAPMHGNWQAVPGVVAHAFTHFRLEMRVYRATVGRDASFINSADQQRCRWIALRDLDRAALPSIMRKIIAHGLADR